jgi:hypothetical protein
MSLIMGALIFIAGGVFSVALMSCFALAKLADQRREKIFASFSEGGGSEVLFNVGIKSHTSGLQSGLRHG